LHFFIKYVVDQFRDGVTLNIQIHQ